MNIIISNSNIGALLQATDKALAQYPQNGEIPENIKGQATLSWLKKEFGGKFFSICQIDELERMNGIRISQEHRDFMQTLHCVDFADMTDETREFLFAKCVDLFKCNIVMSNANYEVAG